MYKFHKGFPSTITIGAFPCRVMCVESHPTNSWIFSLPQCWTRSFNSLEWGGYSESYGRQAEHTTSRFSTSYVTKTATKSLQEKPGSFHIFMFLARIHALDLSFPLTEYGVYPGIPKPLTQPSRYHGFCISAKSILLSPTVLVRIPEAAMLCCRLI